MDQRFETLQSVESEWPLPSPDGKMYYDDFVEVEELFVGRWQS